MAVTNSHPLPAMARALGTLAAGTLALGLDRADAIDLLRRIVAAGRSGAVPDEMLVEAEVFLSRFGADAEG